MANSKQANAKRISMAERAQKLMDIHFPDAPSAMIWRRKTNDGFTTVPRTLPIVMQGVDAQSKGQPAGHTLFGLWARSPDHPLLTIENPATFAAEAGFVGERAVDTWRRRMKFLRDLGLIKTKPGPSGEFHYVLLVNPNVAMELLRRDKKVQDLLYGRFRDRLIEVGGYGDIHALDAHLKELEAAKQASSKSPAAKAADKSSKPKVPKA